MTTVDARDMQCAQALAQVGAAMKRLAHGETLDVRGNADDVKDDLVIWAKELGHVILGVERHESEWRVRLTHKPVDDQHREKQNRRERP